MFVNIPYMDAMGICLDQFLFVAFLLLSLSSRKTDLNVTCPFKQIDVTCPFIFHSAARSITDEACCLEEDVLSVWNCSEFQHVFSSSVICLGWFLVTKLSTNGKLVVLIPGISLWKAWILVRDTPGIPNHRAPKPPIYLNPVRVGPLLTFLNTTVAVFREDPNL